MALDTLLASHNRIVDIAETLAIRGLPWLRSLDLRMNDMRVCTPPTPRTHTHLPNPLPGPITIVPPTTV